MITTEEWRQAFEMFAEQERQRLGEPPTYEEAEAYFAGTLPDSEVETVRDKLCAWPDLLRCMIEPFPPDDGALTPEQIHADVQKILSRL